MYDFKKLNLIKLIYYFNNKIKFDYFIIEFLKESINHYIFNRKFYYVFYFIFNIFLNLFAFFICFLKRFAYFQQLIF